MYSYINAFIHVNTWTVHFKLFDTSLPGQTFPPHYTQQTPCLAVRARSTEHPTAPQRGGRLQTHLP